MKDFWESSGHHLTDRGAGGGLVVTDELLKAYLARPELLPPPEACAAERRLHASLLVDPRRAVERAELDGLADPDARENWQVMLGFRDHLIGHPTLEAGYLDLIRRGIGRTPPLFINQLVHLVLRNALDGCGDPFVLRAGEMFYRAQRLTLHEGALIAADDETISGAGGRPLSPLVSMLGLPSGAQIDVLTEANQDSYWERSDRHDLALDLTTGRSGLEAFAIALERWIAHMLGIEVSIQPLRELLNARLTWYVGLDAEGTKIGDALWNGEAIDEATRGRVAGLFRLAFVDPRLAADATQGEPVYLILAMTADKVIRMKPQNLITGLPVSPLAVLG